MLAIIIPYYKLTFFEETLKSLANQTDKRFKVYIGDDASSENPETLLKKYCGQFHFVYHRFDKNLGRISLVQQWDRCIAFSKNEPWLMILGDDDSLGSNVVEEFYKNLPEIEKKAINLVKFASQSINHVIKSVSEVCLNPKFENAADFYFRRHMGLVRSSLSEHIFRRAVYLKYKFKNYPIAWHSDDYAWITFAENKPFLSINEAIVFITVSDECLSGMTSNLTEKKIAEAQFFIDIVTYKLSLFQRKHRLKFLLFAEQSIKKTRKLYLSEWRILFVMYLINLFPIPLLKLTKRFLKSSIQ